MYDLDTIKSMNSQADRDARTVKLSRPDILILSEALAVFRPDNVQDEDQRQALIVRLGRLQA